jgi:hypothetical protein
VSARAVPLRQIEGLVPVGEHARAKPLPRRLHTSPDRGIEDLSSSERDRYTLRAKRDLHGLHAELTSLRGKCSNRDLAEAWLGSREQEGTVRGWKNLRDLTRYPRPEELRALREIIDAERAARFQMVTR